MISDQGLPNDIFLILFSLLDVCRRFQRLVEMDASLQYRIQLVASGMVDGPPSSQGIAVRLQNLRQYNARLRAGKYSCVEDRSVEHEEHPWERVWSTGGSVAYIVRKAGSRELGLSVPPSIARKYSAMVSLVEFGADVLAATDYTQDLLVGVDKHIPDCSDFQIRIGSLENGRLGHPRAHASILRTSVLDRYVEHAPASVNALRIYSQHIFLVVFVDDIGPYEFQAWNWTTGALVWKTIVTAMGLPRFTLIDDAHIAIIGSRESRISVYCFSPHPDHVPSTDVSSVFCLPGATKPSPTILSRAFYFIHDLSVSLPTSVHQSERPETFSLNPDTAVLVIDLTTGMGMESRHYMLLVPTSLVRGAIQTTHSKTMSHATVDWPDWGLGALLLHKGDPEPGVPWIHPVAHRRPYGSRVPVLVYGEGSQSTVGHILVVETELRTSRRAGRRTGVEDSEREDEESGPRASLDKHILAELYDHPMHLPHTVYRGPVIPIRQGVEPDELVLEESGVSVVYARPDDHIDDRICSVQTWALD